MEGLTVKKKSKPIAETHDAVKVDDSVPKIESTKMPRTRKPKAMNDSVSKVEKVERTSKTPKSKAPKIEKPAKPSMKGTDEMKERMAKVRACRTAKTKSSLQ